MTEEIIIAQTEAWIKSVVIGCNFCPFAAKAILQKSIRYVVLPDATVESTLEKLIYELQWLDASAAIETTLIILPNGFEDFEHYLDLVELAEDLMAVQGYEGVYQVASFHPQYMFAESYDEDPSNYTNRSVYPMLHILREASLTEAIDHYPDAGGIPFRNIEFAQRKGVIYMKAMLASCMTD